MYPIARDLRPVYTAPTEVAAAERFEEFAATWGERYPGIEWLWRSAWAEFVPFLAFPVEVRRVIFSTNAVESLNAGFRRATRARGHFPTEQAALNYTVKAIVPRKAETPGRWISSATWGFSMYT